MLTGGFDPASGRMQSALAGAPTGGLRGIDPADSRMSVVDDPNVALDEQSDLRDALPTEADPASGSSVEDLAELYEWVQSTGISIEQVVPIESARAARTSPRHR
jgi:hypothetical protein